MEVEKNSNDNLVATTGDDEQPAEAITPNRAEALKADKQEKTVKFEDESDHVDSE